MAYLLFDRPVGDLFGFGDCCEFSLIAFALAANLLFNESFALRELVRDPLVERGLVRTLESLEAESESVVGEVAFVNVARSGQGIGFGGGKLRASAALEAYSKTLSAKNA